MAVLIRSSWALTTFALAVATAACGGSDNVNAAEGDQITDAAPAVEATSSGDVTSEVDSTPVADAEVSVDTAAVATVSTTPAPIEAAPTESIAALGANPELRYCMTVPLAAKATTVKAVRAFGAKPNDTTDDTVAIQKALDALAPGETLSFEAGRYLINRSLHMRRPGTTVYGAGTAVIHGTNPDDQALFVEADNSTVSSMTFTAVTQGRRTAPRHARIAVHAPDGNGGYRTVRNTEIRNNRIINAGAPGTPEANAASAAGIIMFRADGFLIANNTIARTLADAIHMTSGTRNGRVLNNVVREVGDDMIAMVSYAGGGNSALNTAAQLKDGWSSKVEAKLVRNIVVSGNHVSGQYWGRGISVVGGESITIDHNTLENVPIAAGILVAREANYQTFGVHNVLIEGNVLRDMQNKAPPYDPVGKYASNGKTGHGAIEIHAAMYNDEASDPMLRAALSVTNVVTRGNTVERTKVNAIRAGVNMNKSVSATDSSGKTVTRTMQTAPITGVSVQGGRFAQLGSTAINVVNTTMQAAGINCADNQVDGKPYSTAACKVSVAPSPKGSTLRCGADGRVL